MALKVPGALVVPFKITGDPSAVEKVQRTICVQPTTMKVTVQARPGRWELRVDEYVDGEEIDTAEFMFHDIFIVDGKEVLEPCLGEGYLRSLFRTSEQKEVIQGHLILPSKSAHPGASFLSDVGMRSADCTMTTSDGKEVLFHRLILETRLGTQWQPYFDGSASLQKDNTGAKFCVTCLAEYPSDAVELYRETVYTGMVTMGDLLWRKSSVRGLADIAEKMSEEWLVATLCDLQTIAEPQDRDAFLEWYTPGKGGYEELYWEAMKLRADDQLKDVRSKKKRDRNGNVKKPG